ncbi:MAG TPA: zf-HC2 domain-containing protein [Candidatus Limnocylindria bacterium]|nr:zf-HC2 domain-containing protein [Candidatus Limnocylindria bacterium]
MDCDEYIRRLAAFLESDLDDAQARELAKHADACSPCGGARVDDGLVRRIRDCLDKSAAPEELRRRILDRVGRSPSP